MTIALWCVLVAGLLPYVATVITKAGVDFDNRDPRAWLPARHSGVQGVEAASPCLMGVTTAMIPKAG